MILMLCGWAGSGKDAAAALLVEEMGFHRVAFADVLKEECSHAFAIPLEAFTTAKKDQPLERHCHVYPAARTPRDVLLAHALALRAQDDLVFIRRVATKIRWYLEHGNTRIVISDWRYPVEYDTLLEEFPTGCIVTARVVRPGIQPLQDASEHALDDREFHYVLQNGGSLSDLRTLLHRMLHTCEIA